ncbi:MAG: glycosyltransferase [Thermoanaerobaculia bacterium]
MRPPGSDALRLSVVIPAYNEEERIGRTLEEIVSWMTARGVPAELIVVLDGCTDGTAEVVARACGRHGQVEVSCIDRPENRGKGYSVREGMLRATGATRLFTDADLAYDAAEIGRIAETVDRGAAIAIAARDLAQLGYVRRSRRVVAVLSRLFMRTLFVPGIADTQAGLKGFSGAVAQEIFSRQRVDGFGFDAEILYIARLRGYEVTPVEVRWSDVPGSKFRATSDVARMTVDILRIWLRHALGRYD